MAAMAATAFQNASTTSFLEDRGDSATSDARSTLSMALSGSTSDQQQLSSEMRAAKVACNRLHQRHGMDYGLGSVYILVSMFDIWGDPSFISPMVNEIPVLFAKTSCAWNPVIYALSHQKLKQV